MGTKRMGTERRVVKSFTLPPDLVLEIKQLALTKGISESLVVEGLLKEGLLKTGAKKNANTERNGRH